MAVEIDRLLPWPVGVEIECDGKALATKPANTMEKMDACTKSFMI